MLVVAVGWKKRTLVFREERYGRPTLPQNFFISFASKIEVDHFDYFSFLVD